MSQSYLDVARQGRNNWWRYLLGILVILFLWLVVGSIVLLIVGSIFLTIHLTQIGLDSEALQQQLQQQLLVYLKTPSVAAYVTVNIPFFFFV